MIKHDVNGDTIIHICNDPEGKVVSTGEVIYKGTTLEGAIKVKHAGMEKTQNLKGKWIGECK